MGLWTCKHVGDAATPLKRDADGLRDSSASILAEDLVKSAVLIDAIQDTSKGASDECDEYVSV